MRSPFHSEAEAFRFVLLLIVAMVPIALAAALGPAWLVVAVVLVVVGALAIHLSQLRMRRLRGEEIQLKMAPPHVGPASERRVLVVANETLAEDSLVGEIRRLASAPGTRVLLLAPALISASARLTGAVDEPVSQARARLSQALERVANERVVAGKVTDTEPLAAVEDAFATFTPDEIVVATRWERGAGGLEPELAGQVRERFAVPVRHLVLDPGSAAQEPGADTEARYRNESGSAAANRFGLKALATAAILAAVLMSAIAVVKSSEKTEARVASQAAAELIAGLPPVAPAVNLSVYAEYKKGPEGEKHDAFTVTEFAVRAGQTQQLTIDNTDTVPHSITSPEAGVNIIVMPGTHTYQLLVKKAGRYLWFCTFVCDEWAMEHPGYMSGYINAS